MTDRYAVIGNPIAHSKSPMIHEAFARQTHQDISYERILAPLDGFADTVRELVQKGYLGVNVTVPFKFEAFRLAAIVNSNAMYAGAANTLLFTEQGVVADNTDGAGLVRDITQNLGRDIQNKRILLLGAGGAAEGVLHPLLNCAPATLVVANRTLDRAQAMVNKISSAVTELCACEFAELDGQSFDIVINATSASLSGAMLPIPNSIFTAGGLAYDMMYGRETPFVLQAKAAGAKVADGLGMLVEQAAEAFYLWRGVRPQTQPVIEMMKAG